MKSLILLFVVFHSSFQREKPVPKEDLSSPASVSLTAQSRQLSLNWDVVELQVEAFGKQYQLRVVRQTIIFHPQLLQYMLDDGVGKPTFIAHPFTPVRGQWYLAENDGPTSLYIELESDNRIKVEGIINEELRIAAIENANGWEHVVYQRPSIYQSLPIATKQTSFCPSTGSKNGRGYSPIYGLRNLPPSVQPEVLLVLDYASSSQFQFNFQSAQKYFGVFYAAINRIFETIKSPKITNIITSMIMTKNSSLESYVIRDKTSGLVDAAETLPAFGKWLFQQKNAIATNFDLAIWSTGLDLGLLKNGNWNGDALGHAYIGSACYVADQMNFNVGLSEDRGNKFNGIRTHAHEIAHLLGAAHDGQIVNNPAGNPGALQCPWSDGYVMSYQFGTKNNFYFSDCSISQIQYMIRSPKGSCLLDYPSKGSTVPINATFPGSFISLDEQCRSRHGPQFVFYKDYLNEVCTKLWCSKFITDNSLSVTTSGPSLEGSPCAINKLCIRGECAQISTTSK